MENGLWNEQLLIATEIAKNYQLEKEVRKASGRKELRCPDPDCQHPNLRYCHGEKKDAFFAHLNNEHCDYAVFDKENSQIMRSIRKIIYEHFKSMGYQVQPEVKVLDHHYTHLFFNMVDGKKVAVEIGTHRISANRIDKLTEEYHNKEIAVKWIVLGNTESTVREEQTYFLKRYLLNESNNKDLLVVSWDGSEVAQYKVDPNIYKYNGRILKSENYQDTYVEFAYLNELTFEGGELSLNGFSDRFQNWLNRKHKAFDKKRAQLEEESRKQMEKINQQEKGKYRLYRERQEFIRKNQNQSSKTLDANNSPKQIFTNVSQINISYEQRRQEILSHMEQQETQARDSLGKRWIKCEICGDVETDDKFEGYGGIDHINLGTCYKCSSLIKLGNGYVLSDFKQVYHWIASECVWVSQWVTTPLIGKESIVDYLEGKAHTLKNSMTEIQYKLVKLIGNVRINENINLNINGEEKKGGLGLWYDEGKPCLLLIQKCKDKINQIIVYPTFREDGKFTRIDLCMPELFNYKKFSNTEAN